TVWHFTTRGVGPVAHFVWGNLAPTQIAGTAFPVAITAQDDLGHTVSNFNGAVSLSASALAQPEAVHILSFVLYTDQTQEYRHTLAAIASYFTNFNESSTVATNPATLEAQLVSKDLFLIPEQEAATAAQLAALGTAWAPVLSNFVQRGGVLIVCSYNKDEHRILLNSGLLGLNKVMFFESTSLVPARDQPLTEGIIEPFPGQFIA